MIGVGRQRADREPSTCSIERSLEVLGERWTLLVIREAFRGCTRFAEFRDALGIAPDVLTARLRTLVAAGILERRPYREPGARERFSYHLTPAGYDLRIVLGALQQWGDAHRRSDRGPATLLRSRRDGGPVRVVFVDQAGAELDVRDVVSVPGPGWRGPASPAGHPADRPAGDLADDLAGSPAEDNGAPGHGQNARGPLERATAARRSAERSAAGGDAASAG